MKKRFDENLKSTSVTIKTLKRQQPLKLKKSINKSKIENASKILEQHSHDIVDAVYAIGGTKERSVKTQNNNKKKSEGKNDENRKIRKLRKQTKSKEECQK